MASDGLLGGANKLAYTMRDQLSKITPQAALARSSVTARDRRTWQRSTLKKWSRTCLGLRLSVVAKARSTTRAAAKARCLRMGYCRRSDHSRAFCRVRAGRAPPSGPVKYCVGHYGSAVRVYCIALCVAAIAARSLEARPRSVGMKIARGSAGLAVTGILTSIIRNGR
jgi:hypothetical protein